MSLVNPHDFGILRSLASRYAEIAHQDVQRERLDRYEATNSLEIVRPVVLIDEVPWGEIQDAALANVCAPELGWIETELRRTLYQWEHFQVDRVVSPVFRVRKRIRDLRGIGLQVLDRRLHGETDTYVSSHAYEDQLQTDDDLAKLHPGEFVYEREASEAARAVAEWVFNGLMEVDLFGPDCLIGNIWDDIAVFRGVENLLLDLALRPEFMHRTAARFMEIYQSRFQQLEAQGLLDARIVTLHCTAGCSRDLPAPDFDGVVRPQDLWGRCAAQIFCSVSPGMHDAFDLAYNQTLFGRCGLLYYGCCEPMDRKIDILRRRFANLRKISITPWADPHRAAESMGRDFVMAAKPNPAFVGSRQFNPAPVEREIAGYCEAARRYGTPMEFVLKDISTIDNTPATLTRWAATVNAVLDRYYPG